MNTATTSLGMTIGAIVTTKMYPGVEGTITGIDEEIVGGRACLSYLVTFADETGLAPLSCWDFDIATSPELTDMDVLAACDAYVESLMVERDATAPSVDMKKCGRCKGTGLWDGLTLQCWKCGGKGECVKPGAKADARDAHWTRYELAALRACYRANVLAFSMFKGGMTGGRTVWDGGMRAPDYERKIAKILRDGIVLAQEAA